MLIQLQMEVHFMLPCEPAALDSATLARRLHDLVGDERRVQVDFLLHLDEFDRRQAFLQAGFGSLWDYCLKALHLREGAAGRRIGAMRVLRRFPRLEEPLRDGRLCLSTASVLGQVLAEDNLDELVRRAAFMTKAEVEHLVVSIRPRAVPRDGIRRLAQPETRLPLAVPEANASGSIDLPEPTASSSPSITTPEAEMPPAGGVPKGIGGFPEAERRVELEAVARDRWSLRVTLDAALKDDLETLKALLSHKLPTGDLTELLREAVQCAIEKHGKRRGAVEPERSGAGATGAGSRGGESSRAIPAAVRREVWERDGGRCTFQAEDGRRCDSRWQLELDHVQPAARGGPATAANLRLRCRKHNTLHAEETYGREHMARFRRDARRPPPTGEFTIAGDSG